MDYKPLTRMQTICLQMAADGKTYDRTAFLLGIKRSTVKSHLRNARERLGAQSTTEAVGMAVAYGIIEKEEIEIEEEAKDTITLDALFKSNAEDCYCSVGVDRDNERAQDRGVSL